MHGGTMRDVSQATALQDFVAGRLGIWAHSTSRLGGVTRHAQGVFPLRTATFPLGAGEASRLPAGGSVAMMLAKDPAMLGDFYVRNPNHRVAISPLPSMTAWYAFPGENGLKITDVIKDHLQTVVNGRAKPDEALK